MWVRLTACLVWALLALSAVFWAFKLLVRPNAVPSHALPVAVEQAARGDPLSLVAAPLAQLAAAVVPEVSKRVKLLGLIAPKGATDPETSSGGVALIAVDGKPPRAYPVGASIDGEWILQSVSARSASIGPQGGAVVAQLEVPALPGPATGSLPPADAEGGVTPVKPIPPPPPARGSKANRSR